VDVAALDRITDATLGTDRQADVFIIDEIGKMECFSRKFVEATTSLLDSDQLVIATVARKGGGFIGRVKQRPDVEIWDVTRDNRDALADKIVGWLRGNWRPDFERQPRNR
jgi:nucleoside-triphosphatase